MDKLEQIFELQHAFDSSLEKLRALHDIPVEQWIQKETLAMISELSELIDEVNFKWWKNPKELDYGAIKEELVDILHFFVSMCLKVGMDAEELFELYKTKNRENFRRQQGQSDKPGYGAV